MPGSLSKLLHYTCYDIGHTWHRSCSFASLEICIIGFIESCKIYGVVYLLSTLLRGKKINFQFAKKLLKDYIQSVCFLTVNAFGYIGSFCVIRHILQHVNVFTASFLPGFVGAVAAIAVERRERRSMLAVYVTNVAAESAWNVMVDRGYVKPIFKGDMLIFTATMAVLGYYFRQSKPLNQMITSIMQVVLGPEESGISIEQRKIASSIQEPQHIEQKTNLLQRIQSVFTSSHSVCPHRGSCFGSFLLNGCQGFGRGYLVQLALNIVPSLPRIVRNPRILSKLLSSPNNMQAGLLAAWFTAFYKGICCSGRWVHNEDRASHGAAAGAIAGLGMYFYDAPSLVLYLMWKTLEALYVRGMEKGYLPCIPYSVEFLYSVSTGYLFHMAAVEKHNLKPSYWKFLQRLTWGRMGQYNRQLLDPWGLDSARDFMNFWPDYNMQHISPLLKETLLMGALP